jgi:glycosyltransferase involved in cell wall biosynthesis/putative flippase GtrA
MKGGPDTVHEAGRGRLARLSRSAPLRFALVGALNAGLNLALLWVMVSLLGVPYLLACAVLFVLLNWVGYRLNKSLTFRLGTGIRYREAMRYFAVMGLSLALNLAMMVVLVDHWHVPYLWASLIVTLALACMNFLAHRDLTFRRTLARDADEPTPLRVLQVSAFFPAHGGGIEVVAGQLATRLAASGVRMTWMAGGAASERPPEAAPGLAGAASPPIIDQAGSVDFIERRIGLPAPIWNLAALRRLWRHVGSCDVVHVHDYLYMSSLAAIVFARLRRRPLVLTQHIGDIPFDSRLPRLILRTLNHTLGRWALGQARQVAFVGKPVMQYFEGFMSFKVPPLLVANGVDHHLYHPRSESRHDDEAAAAGAGSPHRPLRALFVGRFVEKKGVALLQACVSLAGIQWDFVGRGPLLSANWTGDHPTATLHGTLPPSAVAQAMRDADVLVLPSKGEGFPLVVQEALACGTPVLVSQEVAAAFPQLDARCVWVVDADVSSPGPTVQQLRQALEQLRDAPQRVHEARAHATVLASQWSWERCVAAYLDIYARAVPAHPGPSGGDVLPP